MKEQGQKANRLHMQKYSKRNFLNWDFKINFVKVHFKIFLYFQWKLWRNCSKPNNNKQQKETFNRPIGPAASWQPLTIVDTWDEKGSSGATLIHLTQLPPVIMQRSLRLSLCKREALLTRNPRMRQNRFPHGKTNPSPVNFVIVYCYTVISALNCVKASISSWWMIP